jgi:hypothetical protein
MQPAARLLDLLLLLPTAWILAFHSWQLAIVSSIIAPNWLLCDHRDVRTYRWDCHNSECSRQENAAEGTTTKWDVHRAELAGRR